MGGRSKKPSKRDVLQELADSSRRDAKTLEELRSLVDAADDAIIRLLNERAAVAIEIGKVKSRSAQRAYAPDRERELLDRLAERSSGPIPEENLRLIYKEIISASLALESPLTVAYLGPEATFTHQAAKRHFGLSARLTPRRAIADVFADVESGSCEYGVVPIESSSDGVVSHTLDSFTRTDLVICAEVLLEASHHLLTRSGEVAEITRVISHPLALTECRNWLDANLPGVTQVEVSSAARAAQLASADPSVAAVASDLAASLYGLRIAASRLEGRAPTLTRFLVIGRDEPEATGADRTSIMFALKDAPGILYTALAPFASAAINVSRIESRPSRRRAWDYLFFVDLEGHTSDSTVVEAIRRLKQACKFAKVLGSYPRGRIPAS